MPRFLVTERRSYDVTYLIEAEDEADAKNRVGTIIEEDDNPLNSWGDRFISIRVVDQDEL